MWLWSNRAERMRMDSERCLTLLEAKLLNGYKVLQKCKSKETDVKRNCSPAGPSSSSQSQIRTSHETIDSLIQISFYKCWLNIQRRRQFERSSWVLFLSWLILGSCSSIWVARNVGGSWSMLWEVQGLGEGRILLHRGWSLQTSTFKLSEAPK